MKGINIKVLLVAILYTGINVGAWSQYTFFTPEGSFAIEVSLENTDLKRLPIYRNAITSLAVVGDYAVGGTSADAGLSPFLFTASLKDRDVTDILDVSEVIKGQQKIQSGFVKNSQGVLFAGTVEQVSGEGGHLIKVSLNKKGMLELEDLGIPVSGEGVFAITSDASVTTLYGVTYPSGNFFVFDVTFSLR